MDVQGHAAIVTGGGSGLGAETARFLAKAGAKVAVFDINSDGARAVAEEIGGTAVECDVSKNESVEAAFAAAREAQGPARVAHVQLGQDDGASLAKLMHQEGVVWRNRALQHERPCRRRHVGGVEIILQHHRDTV